MYHGKYIIPGILIFLVIFLFPFWNAAGNAGKVPKPLLPKAEKFCVEKTAWMKANHMQLLNNWRDNVVRDAKRVYVATDGRPYNMSLTNTCLKCHGSKTKFCDQCHNYLGVTPYCWDCHLVPKEAK